MDLFLVNRNLGRVSESIDDEVGPVNIDDICADLEHGVVGEGVMDVGMVPWASVVVQE